MNRWHLLLSIVGAALLGVLFLTAGVGSAAPVAALADEVQPLGISALTSSVPITAPLLAEGFEGEFPPPGWILQQLAPGGQWDWITETTHSGDVAAVHPFNFTAPADSWLVTSLVTPTPVSELVFWQYERYISAYGVHSVYVTTGRQDPKYPDFVLLAEVAPTAEDVWTEVRLSLNQYAGRPVYLAFRYEGTESDTWIVDDVVVTAGLTATTNSPTVLGQMTTLTATVPPNRGVTFQWDFGDGTQGTEAVVTHTYSAPGRYTAVITATNDSSLVTASTDVTVLAQTFLPLITK